MFNNILPLMCELDPELRIKLFFTKAPNITYPKHKQISCFFPERIHKYLRPWRLWRKNIKSVTTRLRDLWFGNTKNSIWFSTYFSRPPQNWKGSEVVMVHDLIYELFPELMPDSERIISQKKDCINSADMVFCNSNTTMVDLQRFYPRQDSDVVAIHLAKDKTFIQRSESEIARPNQSKFLLYVGARNFYKGFDHLLDAYSVWAGRERVNLIVVGRAWTGEELQVIAARGLESNVQLMENVDDSILCDLYNQAEAFIYPSIYEGFGIPLLEAMACGCPIVASRIPSTVEVAGHIPIYFEPGDVSSLVKALDQMLMGDGIPEKVNEGLVLANKYSWEKTAEAFYQKLISLHNNIHDG